MEITELEELTPSRVDGVTLPANGTPFLMLKASDPSDKERRKMAASGVAMPDGSYPIPDVSHLKAAIHAVGLGTNNSHAAIRRHIIARAKALGHSDLIPDTWQSDGSIKKEADMADEAQKATPSQESGQAQAHVPANSAAAGQTSENHPGAGPKPIGNSQPGGYEKPRETGNGDPEANAEGYGDTAPDKTVPEDEAESQTREVHSKQDGRGDIAGARGDDAMDEAEDEEPEDHKGPTARSSVSPDDQRSMKASADSDPGSPAWEKKDVKLAQKAEGLLTEALSIVRQFGQREEAEAKKSGRRLSAKSEAALRRALQVIQDLIDNTTSEGPDTADYHAATKEISEMTQDELIKLLDERDARRASEAAKAEKKAAKKLAKSEKKAEKKAKVAKGAEAEPMSDVAKAVAEAVERAVKGAVSPLEGRLRTVEEQPAANAMTNGTGVAGIPLTVATRGETGAPGIVKELQARFDAATTPEEKARLGGELTKARLVAVENMRQRGFAGV